MTCNYKKYEFTAFTEADFLGQGGNGSSIGCGDSFTMPGAATVTMSTWDNDSKLSGDSRDNATDHSGQKASIDGERVGSQMYAESYHVLHGSDGKTYYMIEIEIECHDAPGAGDDYFTFYGAVPPAGVELSVVQTCNVSGCWVDFRCLGAGENAPANEAPTFTNIPSDGIFCVDENQTFVIDLAATDADGDALTYEIVGGADAGAFEIDAATGELTFVAAPDYEAPTDGDGNNVYDVTVKVSDGKGGETIKPLWIKVKDVEEATTGGTCIVVEAEDMQLCGYRIENNANASEGQLIKGSACDWASAQTTFDGPAGQYDLKLSVLDENDGNGQIYVSVNGAWVLCNARLDQNDGGNGVHNSSFRVLEINDIDLKPGDVVKIWGKGNCGEYARIDKLEFCGEAQDPMTAEIGDTIWFDADKDGVRDAAELGAANVTVLLQDAAGNTIDQTTTDADGNYSFTGLAAGDYKVSVVAPALYGFSAQDAGNDDAADSDVDANGMSGVVTLAEGESNLTIDAGLVDTGTASISGTYFCDENDNAVQDAGDVALSGQKVTLLRAGTGPFRETTTDANGNYTFADLDAGPYWVLFGENAEGKTFVDADQGTDDTIDSDVTDTGLSGRIDLTVGEALKDVDAGVVDPATASIEGRVFCDENYDDIDNAEAGVIGVRVELLDEAGAVLFTTLTKAGGAYEFAGLEAGEYSVRFDESTAGGKTLVDQDAGTDDTVDSDADASGLTDVITLSVGEARKDVDAGVEVPVGSLSGTYFEDVNNDGLNNDTAPVQGVLVELLDANGVPTGATATTNAQGNYSFGDLAPGTYGVKFTDAVTGKTLVAADVNNNGNDDIDSDATDLGNGMSQISGIKVVDGQNTSNNDAGVSDPATASIAGRYFFDENNDGVDNGESGIADARVVLVSQTGQSIASTTTAADGSYIFEGLTAGKYSVRFIADEDGKTFVEANVGNDDAIDSDVVTVGNASGNGTTGKVTLAAGEALTDLDAGVERTNTAPEPKVDTLKICADAGAKTVDLLANDMDMDGDALSVLSISDADEIVFVGETLTLESGATVTLNADGSVLYDTNTVHSDLLVGSKYSEETVSYTVSDGNGATGTSTFDVTVCGAASTLEMICDSLPAQLNLSIAFDGLDYHITVADDASTSVDDGFASSVWSGACIDIEGQLLLDTDLTVNVYGLCGEIPEGLIQNPENLDLINWILNEEFLGQDNMDGSAEYNIYDVQEAVWALSDGTTTNNANANEILAKAEAHGEGFMAGEGDVVAVVFDPIAPDASVVDTQTFIMGVDWEALALDCETTVFG